MQIPRWKNVVSSKNYLIQSSSLSSVRTQSALFHSTSTSCEKRKNNWNFDSKSDQQPSKNHIKYATRQKRADAKKALKDLLYHSGSSRFSFQDEDKVWKINGTSSWDAEQEDHSDGSDKKDRSKCSSRRAGKSNSKRLRRKLRNEYISEEFDDQRETVFQATFGSRSYTWSFKPWTESNFSSEPTGFEWRESQNWTSTKKKEWAEDESYVVGSFSDRTTLGLPIRGPLKIEDVKNAFRSSALKWHPDKNQGPSQAMAEEKFKLCVNAYNSLCTALSVV